jgi:PAS domain S-box-containing protein
LDHWQSDDQQADEGGDQLIRQMQDKEFRLRQMLDALPSAVYTTDFEGRLTYFNSVAAAFSGRVPEVGKDQWCVSWKLYYSDGKPMPHDECPMAVALKEGRTVHGIEVIAERPDGKRIWLTPYAIPLRDENGRIVGGINMLVDITDRKQAEEALRASQAQAQNELADTKLLHSISAELIHESNSEPLYAKLVDAAVRIMHSDYASLQMFYPERGTKGELHLLASYGFSPEAVKFWEWVRADSHCSCGLALRTGQRVIVPDVKQCHLMADSEDQKALLQAGILAAQSTPLVSRNGALVGMITTHWRTPHEPSERSLRLLDIVARQAADLIETRRASEKIQALNERLTDDVKALERLQQIRTRLMDSRDLKARLTEILAAAADLTGTDKGNIQLYDAETKHLRVEVHQGFGDRFVKQLEDRGSAAVYDVAVHKMERMTWEDLVMEPSLQGTKDLEVFRGEGIRAIQSTPLVSLNGRLLGLLNMHFRFPLRPTYQHLHHLDLLARMAADFIERWESDQALRTSEKRLQRVLETDAIGIIFFDYSGRVINANDVFLRQTGYRREQIARGELHWRTMTPPEWLETSERQMVQFAETGRIGPYEKEYFLADGSRRWMLFAGRDLGDGSIAEYCLDITEHKASQLRLERFSEELEQQVMARTADLLETQERLRALATELNLAEQRERKRLATELHDHLQQLLVFGKLQIGQARRSSASVSVPGDVLGQLDEMLSDALKYTRTLVSELSPPVLRDHGLARGLTWLADYMGKHNLRVTVNMPEQVDWTLPEDQIIVLYQCVRELLINAAKHTESGAATVTLIKQSGRLQIHVSDEGPGFDLVIATATDSADGGTSSRFGLFSVQERMHALGGTFHVQSTPGKGTTATLSMPLTGKSTILNGKMNLQSTDSTVGTQQSISPRSNKVRVLLVDDHTMVRQGLRSVLESYDDVELVGEAGDGQEAMASVHCLRPSVVIMDINMPKKNGIETTAEIKAHYPDIHVIGLSVNSDHDNQTVMVRAGASMLISKDAAVEQLYGAIHEVMRKTTGGSTTML